MKAKTKKKLVFAHEVKTVFETQSIVDSFFKTVDKISLFTYLLNNSNFEQEITIRKKLSNLSKVLFKHELKDLLKKDIYQEMLVEYYSCMTEEIVKPGMKRIILYFPFEYLPDNSWRFVSTKTKASVVNFLQAYKEIWFELLNEVDLSGDFSDGDIPENVESCTLSDFVCKAAHLTPILIEKKIVSFNEVIGFVENSDNETLKQSIADTFRTLYQASLVDERDIERVRLSKDDTLRDMAGLFFKPGHKSKQSFFSKTSKNFLESIQHQIQTDIEHSNQKLLLRNGAISPERLNWKQEEDKKSVLKDYGSNLANFLKDSTNYSNLINYILSEQNEDILLVIVFGIDELVESCYQNSVEEGKRKKQIFLPILSNLYKKQSRKIQTEIEYTYSRWFNLGLMSAKENEKLKHQKILTSGSFEQIKHMLQIQDSKKLSAAICNNEELLQYIYPVILVYGSLVKGYATNDSDLDVAIFVKSSTSIRKRKVIHRLFKKIPEGSRLKNPPIEFWMSEDNTIQKFNIKDKYMGDKSLVHTLWKGVWLGSKSSIQELQKNILFLYLHDKKNRIQNLRELERGLLQYRLMHNGYYRFNPENKTGVSNNPNLPASKSAFWDSGYRKLATDIFITNVFIPSLEEEK